MNIDGVISRVIKKGEYNDLALKYEIINDVEITDDIVFVEYKQKIKDNDYEFQEDYIKLIKDKFSRREVEQSLPVSVAITAYSRIYMNSIINKLENQGVDIYYTDTDSLWIDGDLPKDLIGIKIGQFKLEFEADEGYFPLPKVYYCKGVNSKGSIIEVKKSKGVKTGSLSFNDYERLSKGLFIIKEDIRFIRNFKEQTIKYESKPVKILPTNNKRNPIFKDDVLVDTKPLLVIDNNILEGVSSTQIMAEDLKQFIMIDYRNPVSYSNLSDKINIILYNLITIENKIKNKPLNLIIYKNKNKSLTKYDYEFKTKNRKYHYDFNALNLPNHLSLFNKCEDIIKHSIKYIIKYSLLIVLKIIEDILLIIISILIVVFIYNMIQSGSVYILFIKILKYLSARILRKKIIYPNLFPSALYYNSKVTRRYNFKYILLLYKTYQTKREVDKKMFNSWQEAGNYIHLKKEKNPIILLDHKGIYSYLCG
jgi:hypothetical protein